MPPPGAGANKYILFGHSLHSTLQALTCLYEAMSSQCTPYPGAPFLVYNHTLLLKVAALLFKCEHCLSLRVFTAVDKLEGD